MHDWSWQPSATPETWSVDLTIDAGRATTPWPATELQLPRVEVIDRSPHDARPGVVSVSLAPPKIAVTSFSFPLAGCVRQRRQLNDAVAVGGPRLSAAKALPRDRSARPVRVRLPNDVIKLEDRLYYLLQPSLDTLLRDGSLDFPFHPFDYQLEGIAFLYPRQQALLADEMGLGKTMQAITAIRLMVHLRQLRRVLLVCPKPLVTNWQREFAQWAPELPLTIVEGNKQRRAWQWNLTDSIVTVANYELLMRDREILADPNTEFDLVVLDEAQRIKNRASATSQVVRSIPRSRSWALTGTPVENSPEDLVGIFEFLAPGFLNSEMKPRAMGRAVADHVLRRTKDKVLAALPPKLCRDAEIDLTPEQRESYQRAEEEGVVRLAEMGGDLTIQHVFELILRLKQICNFDPVTGASSKLERLTADLEECVASGRKALVFSQWVGSLLTLRERLARFGVLEYHGRIRPRQRDATIEQFRDDPSKHVLLMSYGAGGVGLNLQFASYVFLLDRWWNPAVEDQAINRAHRIGVERAQKLGLSQQVIFGLFNLNFPSDGEALKRSA